MIAVEEIATDKIAQAWADYAPAGADPSREAAERAVQTLVRAAVEFYGVEVEELPALIQDEHGCWVTDQDDPVHAMYPTVGLALRCWVGW